MLHQEPLASRRRTLRRAVRVETEVLSDIWEEEVALLATNLSPDGLWLQTPLPLEPGDEVVVSLRPPRWVSRVPLVALASVARVGMHRRRGDDLSAGMGLRFVGLHGPERRALSRSLAGLPPPLPGQAACAPPTAPARTGVIRPCVPSLCLPDGDRVTFQSAGELLTGGRGLLQAPVAVTESDLPDNVVPIFSGQASSPISGPASSRAWFPTTGC